MKRKVGFALLNNLVMAFLPLILVGIISKRMELEDFGRLNLWISMVALFSGIADLGFATSMVSDYNLRGPEESHNVVAAYNRSFYVWLLVFAAAMLAGMPLFGRAMGFSGFEVGLLWAAALVVTIHKYMTSQYMACGRVARLLGNTMVVSLVRLGGILAIAGFVGGRIQTGMIMPLYFIGPVIGILVARLDRIVNWSWAGREADTSRSHLKKVAWIGLSNSVILARTRGDLALASLFFAKSDIAVFSVASIMAGGVNLFTVAVIDNYIPLVGRKTQKEALRMLFKHLLLALPVIVFLCALGWFLAPPVVGFFAGTRYLGSIPILRVLLFCSIGGMAFVPLEAYLYVYNPSRIFFIKILQLILFVAALFAFAPRHSVFVLGPVNVIVSVGSWLVLLYFLYEGWRKAQGMAGGTPVSEPSQPA